MKKLVLSTVATALLATSAMAEIKVGVGIDVITDNSALAGAGTTVGHTPAIRVAVDGLVPKLRAELRYATMSWTNGATEALATTTSVTSIGLGAYYGVTDLIAVGAFFDSASGVTADVDNTDSTTTVGLVLKAETEIAKNFTIASELGFAFNNTSDTATPDVVNKSMTPTTSVTFRYFF